MMPEAKYLQDVDEWVGKTVSRVMLSHSALDIKFTDGTYTEVSSFEDEMEISSRMDDWTKRDLGIITHLEYEELQKKRKDQYDITDKQRRLEEYKKLKAEFEGQGSA